MCHSNLVLYGRYHSKNIQEKVKWILQVLLQVQKRSRPLWLLPAANQLNPSAAAEKKTSQNPVLLEIVEKLTVAGQRDEQQQDEKSLHGFKMADGSLCLQESRGRVDELRGGSDGGNIGGLSEGIKVLSL